MNPTSGHLPLKGIAVRMYMVSVGQCAGAKICHQLEPRKTVVRGVSGQSPGPICRFLCSHGLIHSVPVQNGVLFSGSALAGSLALRVLFLNCCLD